MDTDVQTEVQIPVDVRIAVKQTLSYPDWQEWIPWAWAMLAHAGDVPMALDEDDPDYLSHVITFASLAHLFEVFVDIERGDDGSIEVDFDLLGEDRPFITGIELVRYCERHRYYDEYFPETEYGLFGIAVDERMREVKNRLGDVLGTPRLFTSLSVGYTLPYPDRYDEFSDEYEKPDPTPVGRSRTVDASTSSSTTS